jgi:hypothetical protein
MQQQKEFHPVLNSEDGVFNTHTGILINLVNPTEEMIDLKDIASALSKICRFGGHSSLFYSVAQHCVLVAALNGSIAGKEALLHDASEAYLGDVIKPLKVLLGAAYRDLEANFESVISAKFGLHITKGVKSRIKRFDNEALELEHQAFIIGNPAPLLSTMNRLDLVKDNQYAWSPDLAKTLFLTAFGQYNEAL